MKKWLAAIMAALMLVVAVPAFTSAKDLNSTDLIASYAWVSGERDYGGYIYGAFDNDNYYLVLWIPNERIELIQINLEFAEVIYVSYDLQSQQGWVMFGVFTLFGLIPFGTAELNAEMFQECADWFYPLIANADHMAHNRVDTNY
jgi:hypothetical protein